MKKNIQEIATELCNRFLDEEFIVQRYDAHSTQSIYIKLDYGVSNTIRISDHRGYDYLSYKYNIRLDNGGKKVKKYLLDDEAYFGGILIRQLVERESGEVLKGPLACAELFRSYDAIGVGMNKDLPLLVEYDNEEVRKILPKPRVNILKSSQQLKKKVDTILYLYHKPIDKEILYKEFEDFKDKLYRYER